MTRHASFPTHRARKRFGQHFLEPVWVEKVLRAIDPKQTDAFLEIGPGAGALTRPLAASAARVVAYEIDRDLAASLRGASPANLTLVEGDFLDASADGVRAAFGDLTGIALRVAGNLPYNVGTAMIFRLLDLYAAGLPLVDATVMLQAEVADRLLARPGTGDWGVLAVLVRLRADVERLLGLPPGAFRPPPKVRSALVRLRFHEPRPAPRDPAVFAALVQALFTRRRKTLSNALKAFAGARLLAPGTALERADVDGRRRPETLELVEVVRLADVFAPPAGGAVL